MSLDDKFNSNDGGLVDNIDAAILKAHRRVGEFWQDKTYTSKDELARILHGASCFSFFVGSLGGSLFAEILAVIQGVEYLKPPRKKQIVIEQKINLEASGPPRKFFKFTGILLYTWGIAQTAGGISGMVYGGLFGDDEAFALGIFSLQYGPGFVTMMAAEYIEKSDIGEPPKKQKSRPVLERIKEAFEGYLPRPAQGGAYSTSYLESK